MRIRSIAAALAVSLSLVGCGNNVYTPPATPVTTTIPVPGSVTGTQGGNYVISVFAKVAGTLKPDDMVQLGTSIFVVCQDPNVNPDGTFPPRSDLLAR